jgi:hypothetical protein
MIALQKRLVVVELCLTAASSGAFNFNRKTRDRRDVRGERCSLGNVGNDLLDLYAQRGQVTRLFFAT